MSEPFSVVEVRLFARARELAGAPSLQVQVHDGIDVATLKAKIGAEYPVLAELLARSAVAVNRTYADNHTPIAAGDEIAVIPPVAGG